MFSFFFSLFPFFSVSYFLSCVHSLHSLPFVSLCSLVSNSVYPKEVSMCDERRQDQLEKLDLCIQDLEGGLWQWMVGCGNFVAVCGGCSGEAMKNFQRGQARLDKIL